MKDWVILDPTVPERCRFLEVYEMKMSKYLTRAELKRVINNLSDGRYDLEISGRLGQDNDDSWCQ